MKTIDKTVNLSQKQIRSIFKRYATGIVKILKSKGLNVVKNTEHNNTTTCFWWEIRITKKSDSKIYISLYQYIKRVDFYIGTDYQRFCDENETDLEKEIRIITENTIDIKYPLSNISISTAVANCETPKLNPEKEVAKQLYRALKCHNKVYSPASRAKIKKAEERIKKFTKNEVDKIVESFFQ